MNKSVLYIYKKNNGEWDEGFILRNEDNFNVMDKRNPSDKRYIILKYESSEKIEYRVNYYGN